MSLGIIHTDSTYRILDLLITARRDGSALATHVAGHA